MTLAERIAGLLLIAAIIAYFLRGLWLPRFQAWRGLDEAGARQPGTYSVAVVGESFYQPAVRRCRAGEAVELVHEPDNPHASDGRAVAVISRRGEKIGHIANDSWMKRALFEEGKGATAAIQSVGPSSAGPWGVVLTVRLTAGPLRQQLFSRG